MAGVADDIEQRLYTVPPDRFVAVRDEAVAAARAAGDRDAARRIARLRKPTVAAWLVNLLAINRPELLADLVELAAALRTAQRELRGGQLRELSNQRRGAVNALVAAARDLARAAEPAVAAGKLPLPEVEATLNAALSDEEVAELVRSGRLIRAVSYAGFGEVPRPQLRLLTGGAAQGRPAGEEMATGTARGTDREGQAPRPAGEPAGRQREEAAEQQREDAAERKREEKAARAEEAARAGQRRELTRELTAARSRQRRAEADLRRSAAAEHDGVEDLARIEAELAEVERRRAAAEEEIGRRRAARRTAERAASTARRHAGEVEAAIEAFDAETVPRPARKADSGSAGRRPAPTERRRG
ncbi:hypothetical protein [Polymorphospora rubra]|uniref:Uncharacterized protein n=1 Tax=Polymorphospora rubra TaxID=338584 RepID=A0A810MZ30_9ACTN|nr:hypothetical protein [Polymorphospora rubra]BCJ66372.1 hypothetical protein Prubr_33930 [Polymorphospora rubra]